MGLVAINQSRAVIFEGQNLIVKTRYVTDDGTRMSADGGASSKIVASASFKVYDLDSATPDTVLNGTPTLTVGNVFTTEAQGYLTSGWTKDGTGYDFEHVVLDTTDVTWKGGHRYRIDYTLPYTSTIAPGTQSEGDIKWSVYVRVKESY